MNQQNPDQRPEDDASAGGPQFRVPEDASSLVDGDPSLADAPAEPAASDSESTALKALVAERTADLQRLQAEYVNYKRRVDRDRDVARARGVEAVVNDLLPVLDAIDAARQHEDLGGGFRMVADQLEKVAAKHGLVVYGDVGDVFDPNLHEALMHMPYEGDHDQTVVSAVIQKGAKLHDRIIRPARVGVADPA